MKVDIIDGRTTATAETLADVKTLMSLASGEKRERRASGKHKKHNFMKKCDKCGRMFKGLQGLGKHKSACKGAVVKEAVQDPLPIA